MVVFGGVWGGWPLVFSYRMPTHTQTETPLFPPPRSNQTNHTNTPSMAQTQTPLHRVPHLYDKAAVVAIPGRPLMVRWALCGCHPPFHSHSHSRVC